MVTHAGDSKELSEQAATTMVEDSVHTNTHKQEYHSADDSASGGDDQSSLMVATVTVAPLIHIPLDKEKALQQADYACYAASPEMKKVCEDLVSALQYSGFLRITTPLIPIDLQQRVLQAAKVYMSSDSEATATATTEVNNNNNNPVTTATAAPKVVKHPTDPKQYVMLGSEAECQAVSPVLVEYLNALELTKRVVLQCLAVGLGFLDRPDFFSRLHRENNSTLRLLRYPKAKGCPINQHTGNRCKEHSDYGTITLLLTDGVSGLEAFHNNQWLEVPHAPGALVVNAGSLLERWTNGQCLATLHRVAGPASLDSTTPPHILRNAINTDRTSIAFFADPDKSVKVAILAKDEPSQQQQHNANNVDNITCSIPMNVADYIRQRCGGDDGDDHRSGISFTQAEADRISSTST
jgi:isopenicillin N synthase-like dioxygenase